MRPIHLEMTGFGPFRKKTEIDLSDVELVALVGRTGSGKSTIIDAMTFALFGGVARYGQSKLFPAINQMSNEALVVLTFQLGGRIYKVLRKLVRMSNKRASTKEARLAYDDGTELIGVDEIDAEVTKLLGLDFVQFNKAVFLPQGKFAEFLHETPTNRQKILRGILDLGVYEKVRNLSTAHAANSQTEIQILESQLVEIARFTKELEGELVKKVAELEQLKDESKSKLKEIEKQQEALRDHKNEREVFDKQLAALGRIEKPKGLDSLADLILVADENFAKAAKNIAGINEGLTRAEKDLEDLTTRETLIQVIASHEGLQDVQLSLAKKRIEMREIQDLFDQATLAGVQADAKKRELSSRYEQMLTKSKVSAFAKELVVGEPCPLCLSSVSSIPDHEHEDVLDGLRKQRDSAMLSADAAFKDKTTKESSLGKLIKEVSELELRDAHLNADLVSSPSLPDAREQLEKYESVLARVTELTRALRLGQQEVDNTRNELEELRSKAAAERSVFEDARDALSRVNLDPPKGPAKSIVLSWTALLFWCEETQQSLHSERKKNDEALLGLNNMIDSIERNILDKMEQMGVAFQGGFNSMEVTSTLERTHANAVSELALVQSGLKRKQLATSKLKEQKKQHNIYKTLASNLESRNFEAWLMQEVLAELAEGATQHLLTLSSGAYSLELRDKNFVVRDHHNADEIRVAESLSGGETFLASLSLALALSDSIAGMAEEGAAKLESLFLDEGFGTLDSETLDVVASSIEELGSEGRMMGIVTHVEEIAQRMPVRIKVTKGPETSYVERLET